MAKAAVKKVDQCQTIPLQRQELIVKAAPHLMDYSSLSLEQVVEMAGKLSERYKALAPKACRSVTEIIGGKPRDMPTVRTATPGQARMMARLREVKLEVARLQDPKIEALLLEQENIGTELKKIISEAEVGELVAESVGLRYCAEPRDGGVSVKAPSIGHTLREIK